MNVRNPIHLNVPAVDPIGEFDVRVPHYRKYKRWASIWEPSGADSETF